ncbi:recombinase RecA [Lactococcus lactis]|uniref:recombinase RecA n=1 Tax=Lactococcus lactis TaxID=1358 RepID=UPI00288C79B1|nr:recombinase RecA [Lactococcus lactis]MDT2868668.1 recombinase RecA [Lactococcus lactis]
MEQPDYTPRRVHKINDPEEKKLAILKATQSIEKKYGSNTILDDEGKAAQHVQALPTGILSLDCAIGIGGYPKGRLIELFGAESSGKTTVALQAVAETQKSGGYVAYIDAENSLDIEYAENLGVKAESLIFAQPDTGEEAFYMINEFVKTGAFDLIVVDSVAALTPASEIDGVSIPGQQAKMMSEQLSKLVSKVNQTKTVIIFINQVRSTMSGLFLNKETTPGGSALKFYSSVRIEVKSGEKIKDGIDTIGKKTTLHTVKNKVSAPYKKPTVINVFGDGFSQEIDVVTLAIQMGVVKKMNEWYSFNGQKLGRGIFSVKEYLVSHKSVFETLKHLTRESLQFY